MGLGRTGSGVEWWGGRRRGEGDQGGLREQKLTILPAAALEDLLLVGVLADKAIDGDLLALPNAVAPSHSLQIILQHTQSQ